MTVYIVYTYGNVKGVYATKEIAEKIAKEATRGAAMGGSRAIYYVKEMKVENWKVLNFFKKSKRKNR